MSDLPPSVLPIRLPVWLAWSEPVLLRLFAWRYFRFATVGASGTVVNIAVLYVMQEWVLLAVIGNPDLRLSVALACAIALAGLCDCASHCQQLCLEQCVDMG